LKIENVGTFVKVEFNTPNWNGEFKKYNAIYADNGIVGYIRKPRVNLLRSNLSVEDKVNNFFTNIMTMYNLPKKLYTKIS
jgi:hypothetical protein